MRSGCCRASAAPLRSPGWTASSAATPDSPGACGSSWPGSLATGAPGSLVGSPSTTPGAPVPNPVPTRPTPGRLFPRGSWAETSRIAEVLRKETVGGALLLAGTLIALVWANSPWSDSYASLRDLEIGPEALHLHLSLGTWAADGLLAVFFFVAGLELKREFVAGDLRDPRKAALPVAAAFGGMLVPALCYVLVNLGAGGDTLTGWAIPTATDIAFALAVLAVVSTHLPTALRTFLLTLAVVDDLPAITIIAVFYTSALSVTPLLLALLPLALFGVLVQRRGRRRGVLLPPPRPPRAPVHPPRVHATPARGPLALTLPAIP